MREGGYYRSLDFRDGEGVLGDRMVDTTSYLLISVVMFCFGLLVSFQIAHIYYVRRMTRLAKRSIDTGTIAPILVELEMAQKKMKE